MKKGKTLSKIFPGRNPHYLWASKLLISTFMFFHHHQQFTAKFWRRPKQNFVKSAAWLQLDREKNQKKERAQESPRVLPSSISTSNNSRAASSRCNWSQYSRNSSRSTSFSKSFANWSCSPSEPTNFELIQTFWKVGSMHYKIDQKKTKKNITCGHV